MSKPAASRELSASYVWGFPGCPIRIHISLAAISKLREQLFTGYDPSAAKEIGGLLLGKAGSGQVDIVDIRSFSLESECRHFVLTNPDKARIRTLLQEQQVDDAQPAIVGYFRSDLREGIRLSEADIALSKELFRDPHNVFLIINGQESGTPKAGFFFWDNGSIFAEASFMQFPLDETLLVAKPSAVSAAPAAPSVAPTTEISRHAAAASYVPAMPQRNYRPIWILAFCAITLTIGFLFYRQRPLAVPQSTPVASTAPVTTVPTTGLLALSAVRTAQDVTIVWDSKVRAVSQARVGVLTIRDGSSQVEFPMTAEQLKISRMLYAPQAERLELTLEVFGQDGKSVRDSVMLAFLKSQPISARASAAPPPEVSSRRREAPIPARREEPPTLASVRTFSADAANASVAAKPINGTSAAPITNLAPPSQIAAVNPSAIKAPDFLAPAPLTHPAPKAPESPSATSRSRIVLQSESSQTPSPIPPTLRPPVPIRQPRPEVPANVSAMVKRRTIVQVRVSIDQNGRVTKAEPLIPLGGINQYLGASAASAARLWTFQPARTGDTPTNSELVLNFTFAGSDKQE